ncbi:MAG: TRAP transporter small permease [Desulfobacterales bacterium]|nr:TRAP transporter small permease [Desulfobacterales bacterium]
MNSFLKRLNGVYVAALLLSFVVIISCVILQIISRYVFNQPLIWTEEISLFAFCWFTFLGSAVSSWEDNHLEVDFFYNRMGQAAQKWVEVCIKISVTVLCAYMSYDAVLAMKSQMGITSVAVRLPIPLYTLAILLGFVGMTIFTLYHLVQKIKS